MRIFSYAVSNWKSSRSRYRFPVLQMLSAATSIRATSQLWRSRCLCGRRVPLQFPFSQIYFEREVIFSIVTVWKLYNCKIGNNLGIARNEIRVEQRVERRGGFVASFGEKGGRLFSTRRNHHFPRHDANGEEDGRRRAERSEARCCGRRGWKRLQSVGRLERKEEGGRTRELGRSRR